MEWDERGVMAGFVFNPTSPISEKDLFSGRRDQIMRVIDVIFQKGQHAIIFGERGVGKTSLANVIASFVPASTVHLKILPIRINCDTVDTFGKVWRKVFDAMELTRTTKLVGFNPPSKVEAFSADDFLPSGDVSPSDVQKSLLKLIDSNFRPVIVIDEFDRLDAPVRRLFADLIKALSDYSIDSTIVLIGVGESVEKLIQEHQSVSRALSQIDMPRMSPEEIKGIFTKGLPKLEMSISEGVLSKIALLTKGLPHYAHKIGLFATRHAIHNHRLEIVDEDFDHAIDKSIESAQRSITTNYNHSIDSYRKKTLFADVLLACALAPVNEMGEFSAQDIIAPMFKITSKNYNTPAFAQHLKEFSDTTRGNILIMTGSPRRRRYKFSDPLMQPFIIMKGIKDGKINSDDLSV